MIVTPNLTALANEAGSDKGTKVFHAHGYTLPYSFIFEEFRRDQFSMLEIGLHRGGVDMAHLLTRKEVSAPSVMMWLAYFPNAFVYGFDISNFHSVELDRFEFIQGDIGLATDLDQLKRKLPMLKLIIDDGSHAAYHQQLAFLKLFPLVRRGGYYIIEDLHAENPIETELPNCKKTIDVVETFLVTGRFDIPFARERDRQYAEENIRHTFVHRNDRGGVHEWTMKMVVFEKK